MKDDKTKKYTAKDLEPHADEWAAKFEAAIAAPEPAEEAPLPTGTHADNVKKNRRPGKP